jgi:hypothetical protein
MIGQQFGHSLELFFVDGSSDGMLTATIFNWTGHVLVASRAQVRDALLRPEAIRTGVYILLGEDELGTPLAYIGEGENISDRIRNHDSKKGWWSRVAFVTSSENVLNKAHIKYLEARLVERAKEVGKVGLDNTNNPTRPTMTEAAAANMENFLEFLHVLLPAVRIDCFISEKRGAAAQPVIAPVNAPVSLSPVIFELTTPLHGLHATAFLVNGEFVVQAGSIARENWMGQGSEDSSYARLYAELRRTGVLVPQENHCVFSVSYAFNSPSAAGAVINGRPTNGTLAWKVKGKDETYKEWEAKQLDGELLYDQALARAMSSEVDEC